jgi:hypothetical protein
MASLTPVVCKEMDCGKGEKEKAPLPVMIRFDDSGNTTNAQHTVATTKAIVVEEESYASSSRYAEVEALKATCMHALFWANTRLSNILHLLPMGESEEGRSKEDGLRVLRTNKVISVVANRVFGVGELRLVPYVSKITDIAAISFHRLDALPKGRISMSVPRRLDQELGKSEFEELHFLLTAKPQWPVDGMKSTFLPPAWSAQRSSNVELCNMVVDSMSLSQVNDLGGFAVRPGGTDKIDNQSHVDGSARDLSTTFLSIPVLLNTKALKKGQELILYEEKMEKTKEGKKEKTWKDGIKAPKVKM